MAVGATFDLATFTHLNLVVLGLPQCGHATIAAEDAMAVILSGVIFRS
jgi:hypothetical protein